jgi:hypothetical protein
MHVVNASARSSVLALDVTCVAFAGVPVRCIPAEAPCAASTAAQVAAESRRTGTPTRRRIRQDRV